MTIYFVDEDYPKFHSWLVDLEYRGFTVVPIGDADRAYSRLKGAADIEWVIIDVMLAATEEERTRYDVSRTGGSLETGLVLVQDLVQARPDVFPLRSQLLTNTTNQHTYAAAVKVAAALKMRLTEKTAIDGARDFGDQIIDAMIAAGVYDDEASLK